MSRTSASPRYVVEVNDCLIMHTRQGSDWWANYQFRYGDTDRIVWVELMAGGGIAHLPCDDREDAEQVKAMFVETGGIHPGAVKVKRVTS